MVQIVSERTLTTKFGTLQAFIPYDIKFQSDLEKKEFMRHDFVHALADAKKDEKIVANMKAAVRFSKEVPVHNDVKEPQKAPEKNKSKKAPDNK